MTINGFDITGTIKVLFGLLFAWKMIKARAAGDTNGIILYGFGFISTYLWELL